MPAHRIVRRGEAGQTLPLLALVLALAAAAALVVGQLGVAASQRARAQTAADAAALAGAAAGSGEARSLASANGGELLTWVDRGGTVEVVVAVGEARARATAARPAPIGVAGGGDREGLAPALVAALARADELLGAPVPVVSGHRTRAEQEALWAARHTSPYPVAPPGTSLHEEGLAIDVPADFVSRLSSVAAGAGLCQPLPESDPIHFEPCPPTSPG